MKKNMYLLLFIAGLSLYTSAKSPDEATHHQMVQYLKLLPDTLYFNQDYYTSLAGLEPAHLSLDIDRYQITQSDGHISISVPWSNRETDMKMLRVFTGEGPNRVLIGEKPVTIIQKLKDKVSYDSDLFRFDDNMITLDDHISIEQIGKSKNFDINPERFQAKDLHVSGFTVTATATGQSVENKGNEISTETMSFISGMKTGDKIHISNIRCSYMQGGQSLLMNLNYTATLSLSPDM